MAGSGVAHMRNNDDVVLEVRDLVVEFKVGGGRVVNAVSKISFDVCRGETLAVVGESGCGKTTLGKAVLQLPPPNSGDVVFEGTNLTKLPKEQLRSARTAMQMVFQDPISSLDPRMTVRDLIEEPLWIWERGDEVERAAKINELLNNVGLDPKLVLDRRSYEFSGGQCQRISIARSLALEPRMLICDEPVSALDVSIQAQIMNLLKELKRELGIGMLFITHDLALASDLCDRVAVVYAGQIREIAETGALLADPRDPYAQRLLASIPRLHEPTPPGFLPGAPPDLRVPIAGCRFAARCPLVFDRCRTDAPPLAEVGDGHGARCFLSPDGPLPAVGA